jgi:tetratricopeptide (TPR) repeat protein
MRSKGDLTGALAVMEKAQALEPDNIDLGHYLGYLLAICPDPKRRDAKRAVELIEKAVAAVPNTRNYWRALGLARHFAGDDEAAVKALTRSLELQRTGEAFDYFLLAAAHQQLGNKEEAHEWYGRGVEWMVANRSPYAAELAFLRADAEARLGVSNPAKPLREKPSTAKKE